MTLSEYLIEAVAHGKRTTNYRAPLNVREEGDAAAGDEYGRLVAALDHAGAKHCMKRITRDLRFGRDTMSEFGIFDKIINDCGSGMGYATLLYDNTPQIFIVDRDRNVKTRPAFQIKFESTSGPLRYTFKYIKTTNKTNAHWTGKDNTEWVPNSGGPYPMKQVHVPRMFAAEINRMLTT